MRHFAFLTGVVALACGHLARSAIVSNGSLSAISEAIEERTFLEPIAASFFADHSSTQVGISKRSLTIRDSSTNFTGNVALQNAGSMYYAARDFRRGFGQQYARFDVKGDGKKKVLQTEEFRDVIGEVVCHDGKIGLSFTQDIDFQQVRINLFITPVSRLMKIRPNRSSTNGSGLTRMTVMLLFLLQKPMTVIVTKRTVRHGNPGS